MKLNYTKQFILTTLLLLISLSSFSQAGSEDFFITEVVQAAASNVNARSRTITFNNKTYKYDVDVSKSEYDEEDAKNALLKFREIETGEVYFFTLYYYGVDEENAKIVFVSKTEPMS